MRKLPSSSCLRYIQLLRTCLTFAVTLPFLVYSRAFSVCLSNRSGIYGFLTKSSANINPDTASSSTVTPCFAASTATIMSLICTLNKFGDGVHLCATHCKFGDGVHLCATHCKTCKRLTYFDIFPSSITAIQALSVVFLIFLYIFPSIPIPHNFSHNPFLQTV